MEAVDPIYECELALELKMSLSELRYGRGTPMSAHELLITWPQFFQSRQRLQDYQQKRGKDVPERVMGGGT